MNTKLVALLTSFVVLSVILIAFSLSRPALSPPVADPAPQSSLTLESNSMSDSKYLGEGIILSLSVDKQSYGLLEDVTIEWSLTNNGSRTMVLSRANVEFLIVDKNGSGIWASQDFLLIEHEVQEPISPPPVLLDDLTLDPGQSWMGRRVIWDMTKQEVICTRGSGGSFSCSVIDGQTVPPGEYELRFRPNIYYRISREGGDGFRYRGLPLSEPLRIIFEYRMDHQEAIQQESPGGPPPASVLGTMVNLQEAALIAVASGFEARQPTQIPDGISLVGVRLWGLGVSDEDRNTKTVSGVRFLYYGGKISDDMTIWEFVDTGGIMVIVQKAVPGEFEALMDQIIQQGNLELPVEVKGKAALYAGPVPQDPSPLVSLTWVDGNEWFRIVAAANHYDPASLVSIADSA